MVKLSGIRFLTQRSLQAVHLLRVLSCLRLQGLGFIGDFGDGLLRFCLLLGSLGFLLGVAQVFRHIIHHLADLRSHGEQLLARGLGLRGQGLGDLISLHAGFSQSLRRGLRLSGLVWRTLRSLTSLVVELLRGIASLVGSLLRGIGDLVRLQATRCLWQLAQLLGGLLCSLGNGRGLIGIAIGLLSCRVEGSFGFLHHRIGFQRACDLGEFGNFLASLLQRLRVVLLSGDSSGFVQFIGGTTGAVCVERGFGVGQRILLAQLCLVLQLLACLGQFALRLLGGHQALLVSLLLGRALRVFGDLRGFIDGVLGLLKRSQGGIVSIGHRFAQLLGTARGFIRHVANGF